MKAKLLILLLAFPLAFACKSPGKHERETDKSPKALMQNEVGIANEEMPTPAPLAITTNNIEKKIIKSAEISIEVNSYETTRKKLGYVLTNYKAEIVSEDLQNTSEMISNSISIKVPAELFEELIGELSKFAKRVDYQNIETQDVTTEYIDVEARLKNKHKVEQTYIRLLRKTKSIDDILKIESKLGEIREEIESAEGRLEYLKNQVNYSTINLTIYQKVEYKYHPEDTPSFFQRLIKSLDSGWKNTVTFILFLFKLWPLWLIVAAIYFGWRYIVKLRKQRKQEHKRRKKMEKKEHREQQDLPQS